MCNTSKKPKVKISCLILSIVAFIFGLLLPIVTYITAPISIILAAKSERKDIISIILAVIALVIAFANSIIGVLLVFGILG